MRREDWQVGESRGAQGGRLVAAGEHVGGSQGAGVGGDAVAVPGVLERSTGVLPCAAGPKQLGERSWAFRRLSLGKWVCCPRGCWQDGLEGGAQVTPGEQGGAWPDPTPSKPPSPRLMRHHFKS